MERGEMEVRRPLERDGGKASLGERGGGGKVSRGERGEMEVRRSLESWWWRIASRFPDEVLLVAFKCLLIWSLYQAHVVLGSALGLAAW